MWDLDQKAQSQGSVELGWQGVRLGAGPKPRAAASAVGPGRRGRGWPELPGVARDGPEACLSVLSMAGARAEVRDGSRIPLQGHFPSGCHPVLVAANGQ